MASSERYELPYYPFSPLLSLLHFLKSKESDFVLTYACEQAITTQLQTCTQNPPAYFSVKDARSSFRIIMKVVPGLQMNHERSSESYRFRSSIHGFFVNIFSSDLEAVLCL